MRVFQTSQYRVVTVAELGLNRMASPEAEAAAAVRAATAVTETTGTAAGAMAAGAIAATAVRSSSKMAVLAKMEEMEQAMITLKDEQKSHKALMNHLQAQVQEAVACNGKLAGENASLLGRICELESWVEEKEDEMEALQEEEGEDDDKGDGDASGLSKEQRVAVGSKEAAESREIKVSLRRAVHCDSD